ncbi:MAG: hypothetical protein NVSMB26_27820 [Beijerinckiaceae bacterium]
MQRETAPKSNGAPPKQNVSEERDGERIDSPQPDDDGAIRGAREDLDIAHALDKDAERNKDDK